MTLAYLGNKQETKAAESKAWNGPHTSFFKTKVSQLTALKKTKVMK